MTVHTPFFETDRLILRPSDICDAQRWCTLFNNFSIARHMSAGNAYPASIKDVEEHLHRVAKKQGDGLWVWSIFERDKPNNFIGVIHLFVPAAPENRGFWLGEAYWGKGYMSEALAPVDDFFFNTLKQDALYCNNAITNTGSRRIKEKQGFTLVKTYPQNFVDPNVHYAELWRKPNPAFV